MSIINDALKKAQLNFKKPKKDQKIKSAAGQSKSGEDITNVYEKMYKARQEQADASASQAQQGKSPTQNKSKTPLAKTLIKTFFVIILICVLIVASFFILKNFLPIDDFIQSVKKAGKSSRIITKPAPKKRIYRPGELVLNGTSLIDGKQVALINDEIYEIGGIVNGKEITSIGLNEVKLRDDQKVFTLKIR